MFLGNLFVSTLKCCQYIIAKFIVSFSMLLHLLPLLLLSLQLSNIKIIFTYQHSGMKNGIPEEPNPGIVIIDCII